MGPFCRTLHTEEEPLEIHFRTSVDRPIRSCPIRHLNSGPFACCPSTFGTIECASPLGQRECFHKRRRRRMEMRIDILNGQQRYDLWVSTFYGAILFTSFLCFTAICYKYRGITLNGRIINKSVWKLFHFDKNNETILMILFSIYLSFLFLSPSNFKDTSECWPMDQSQTPTICRDRGYPYGISYMNRRDLSFIVARCGIHGENYNCTALYSAATLHTLIQQGKWLNEIKFWHEYHNFVFINPHRQLWWWGRRAGYCCDLADVVES